MNEWQLRRLDADLNQVRFALAGRMHLLGSGQACDLQVAGLPIELLQLWRDGESYRMVRMGPPGSVKLNGIDADERVLIDGDVLASGSIALRFERATPVMATAPVGNPVIATAAPATVAAAMTAPPPAFAAPTTFSATGTPRWVSVAAAAWAASEGKVAKATQQQWEKVLREGTPWNVEACAADMLAAASIDDERPQAAVNALRDAIAKRMIRSAHRGVARKRFIARLIVQVFVLLVFGGALIGGALVLRSSVGIDINGFLDGLLRSIRGLSGGGL